MSDLNSYQRWTATAAGIVPIEMESSARNARSESVASSIITALSDNPFSTCDYCRIAILYLRRISWIKSGFNLAPEHGSLPIHPPLRIKTPPQLSRKKNDYRPPYCGK